MPSLADEITRLIREKGITQKALAEACGVNQTFISKLIRGERDRMGADVYLKLCKALSVPCDHFETYIIVPIPPPGPKRGRK